MPLRLWVTRVGSSRVEEHDSAQETPRYRPRFLPRDAGVAELASLFAREHLALLAHWRKRTRSRDDLRRGQQVTASEGLPELVVEVTRDLGRQGLDGPRYSSAAAPAHGVHGFQIGLSVREVVLEYRFLREAYASVASRNGLSFAGDAARIVHARLDQAIGLAVDAFVDEQSLTVDRKHREQLAFLVHDLRAPVSALALAAEELEPQERDEALSIMGRNVARLDMMLEHALAKYVGGSFKPRRRRLTLRKLVRRLIDDMRPLAVEASVAMSHDVPADLTVLADPLLLSQVFQNLLGNALAHAAPRRVQVRAWRQGDEVVCEVVDDGKGIPEHLLSTVFEPLESTSGKPSGGLGLTIVKRVVEAHGGTVTARAAPGGGTSFVVALPA